MVAQTVLVSTTRRTSNPSLSENSDSLKSQVAVLNGLTFSSKSSKWAR